MKLVLASSNAGKRQLGKGKFAEVIPRLPPL